MFLAFSTCNKCRRHTGVIKRDQEVHQALVLREPDECVPDEFRRGRLFQLEILCRADDQLRRRAPRLAPTTLQSARGACPPSHPAHAIAIVCAPRQRYFPGLVEVVCVLTPRCPCTDDSVPLHLTGQPCPCSSTHAPAQRDALAPPPVAPASSSQIIANSSSASERGGTADLSRRRKKVTEAIARQMPSRCLRRADAIATMGVQVAASLRSPL